MFKYFLVFLHTYNKVQLEIMMTTTTYTKQYQPKGGKVQGQLRVRCNQDTEW